MSQYRAGTVAVNKGSNQVLGTATLWAANVTVGNWFEIKGEGIWYDIQSIADDGTITLATAYGGDTNAKASYVIQRDFTKYNGYPLVAYGDVDTATLLAYALASIDLQLAQVQPNLTGLVNGNIQAAGSMSFSGVTDGDLSANGAISIRSITDGDLEIDGNLMLSGDDLVIQAASLASVAPIVTVSSGNEQGLTIFSGMKVERGGIDAYWTWNETLKRWAPYTSVDDLDTPVLSDIGAANIYGQVASPSDVRLKRVLGPIRDALYKVNQLEGVRFLWNEHAYILGRTGADVGLLAQDVEHVLPEAVMEQVTGDRFKFVQYDKLIPLLVQAINELSAQVAELQGVSKVS